MSSSVKRPHHIRSTYPCRSGIPPLPPPLAVVLSFSLSHSYNYYIISVTYSILVCGPWLASPPADRDEPCRKFGDPDKGPTTDTTSTSHHHHYHHHHLILLRRLLFLSLPYLLRRLGTPPPPQHNLLLCPRLSQGI